MASSRSDTYPGKETDFLASEFMAIKAVRDYNALGGTQF